MTVPYLELDALRKEFGGSVAVERFELTAERGEFISLLGPSGCGKTTTLRMIAGFEQPSSGRIVLDGEEITHRPASRRNVGMVFQSYALFPNMTVAANIGFGLRMRGRSGADALQRTEQLLELVHLPGLGGRYPYQLSGGQQQRVALARAIAFEPSVLLLDEPLSALDAKIRVSLRREIRAIQRQLGITTVYVTHDQEEALSLSDRVVVMSNGRIEQVGTPFEIYNFPATRFVASFVGTLNVLAATVVDPVAGRVALGDQEVDIGRSLELASGSLVSLAVRPEMISLANGRRSGNRVTGEVADVSFLGSVVRVRVRVASGSGSGEGFLALDAFNDPHRPPPRDGESVTVTFRPEACLVLDR